MPCWSAGNLRLQHPGFCLRNRNCAAPDLIATGTDLADHMAQTNPGTVTPELDANFPFFDGFAMLPHLSHKDGRQVDIAFWYDRDDACQPGLTRSPLGCFAFEQGPTDCPNRWLTLRWDLEWLQPLPPPYPLDRRRMQSALQWLAQDARVTRVFLEPHLRTSLGVAGASFGFQGCLAPATTTTSTFRYEKARPIRGEP